MPWLRFAFGSAILMGLAIVAAVRLGTFEIRRLNERVRELETEKRQLVEYADRLSASRRVAQVDVLRQRVDESGRTISTLLWQEIGPDGTLGIPVAVEVSGKSVYFEALVIKFATQHVGEGDPERGASLALFRRIFGDQQAPESAKDLDRSARPVKDSPRERDALHDRLWARFWEFVDDPKLAETYGVRVAQCEAPSVPVAAGQIWEVAVDAAGGLNLRRIGTREASGG